MALALVMLGGIRLGVSFGAMGEIHPQSWGYDIAVFYHAAERIESTGSPYMASQLAGPFDLPCPDCYLYPPPLAQALVPLTAIPLDVVKIMWLALQAVAMFAAVWLASVLGGARRGPEVVAWSLVAVVWYVPVFASLWFGNVSTLIALCVTLVAMGGLAAGLGAAVGSLLKVAPATLIPATLVMDQRARTSLLVSVAVIVGISVLAAPQAWLDFPTVLLNMLRGSGDDARNYAPATAVVQAGLAPWVATLARVATIIVAFGCVIASVWVVRRPDGMPLAALLGTVAMLLIPGTLWYHYLVALLPFAAMAWARSALLGRVGLLASTVLVSLASVDPFVVLTGALLLTLIAGRALWPDRRTISR